MKEKSVLPVKKDKSKKVWYKCLRCTNECKKQGGLKENYLCPQCGEISAYYVKEMSS